MTKSLLNSFRAGYLYNSVTYGYDLTPAWLTQPSISFAYGASGVELNNLPVGTYTLEVLIQDVTELARGAKVPDERKATRQLTFRVDPRGAGLAFSPTEQGAR